MIQAASDGGNAAALVFFLFDLLYLDGEDVSARPLIERKQESLVDAGGRCSQHRKLGSHGLSAGGKWIRTIGSALG
jgi:ATP-dependent DNA ligase